MENQSCHEVIEDMCIVCLQPLAEIKPIVCQLSFWEGDEEQRNTEGLRTAKSTKSRELKGALGLFSVLVNGGGDNSVQSLLQQGLNVGGNTVYEEGVNYEGDLVCPECSESLIGILRLQEMIEQNQTWQMEHVERLKKSLLDSASTSRTSRSRSRRDDYWIQIRNLLIECLHARRPTEPDLIKKHMAMQLMKLSNTLPPAISPVARPRPKKRKLVKKTVGRPKSKQEEQVKKKKKIRNCNKITTTPVKLWNCSVKLERVDQQNNPGRAVGEEGNTGARRSKLEAVKFLKKYSGELDAAEESSDNDIDIPQAVSSSPKKKKAREKVVGRIQEDLDFDYKAALSDNGVSDGDFQCGDDSVDDEYVPSPPVNAAKIENIAKATKVVGRKEDGIPQSSEEEQRVAEAPKKTKKKRSRNNPRFTDAFQIIQDNILLFKCTLMKYSHEGFFCLERDCSHTIQGTDELAFQQMRTHVAECHSDWKKYSWNRFKPKSRKTQPCPICKKGMALGGFQLRSHFLQEHKPTQAVCEVCWKPMKPHSIPYHLYLHKNAEEQSDYLANGGKLPKHLSDESHECTTCHKQCPSLENLRLHEQTHLPAYLRKQYTCSQPNCDATFMHRGSLRIHMARKHNQLNHYAKSTLVCPICSVSYRPHDQGSFKNHMRTHTGEKPFQCDICGKKFGSKKLLTCHSAVHSDKVFQCEFCTMSYKHKMSLKQHQKAAHRELIPETDPEVRFKSTRFNHRPDFIGPKVAYPCQHCDKFYFKKWEMIKHVTKHHPLAEGIKTE